MNGQRVMSGLAAYSNRRRTKKEQIAHPMTLAYDKDGEAYVCHFLDRGAAMAHLIEAGTGAWALCHGDGVMSAGSTPPVPRRMG